LHKPAELWKPNLNLEIVPIRIADKDLDYKAELIIRFKHPLGMDFLPDGSIILLENCGRIIPFKDGKKLNKKRTRSLYARGQGVDFIRY
jgi:hypothetical protein